MSSDESGVGTLRERKGNLTKSMNVLFPQELDSQCRVCNEPVVDGRWNYCSERCRKIANAVQRMFIWDEVREKIKERDDYTCQRCGLSYEKSKRAYRQVNERIDELTEPLHHSRSDHPAADYDRWRRARRELKSRYGKIRFTDGMFQVDHITRIADGGHPFEESNLQTLCEDCHQEKTAEENRVGKPEPTEQDPEERPEVGLEEYINA